MKELEAGVRSIEKDGLTWGASSFVAVGFGIKKLQINLVVEDDKISLDELQAQIEEDEDHVQSTDIVSLLAIYTLQYADTHVPRLLCKSCRSECLKIAMHCFQRCFCSSSRII